MHGSKSLAETTLLPGEEAVLAVAFDRGEARAALPLARIGRASMRALTSPYTTIYAPALPNIEWARALGAGLQRCVEGSLHLDALDARNPGVEAFLKGMEASGLIRARYFNFVNFFETVSDFGQYWGARSSRLKETVRRKFAKARTQEADFKCYSDGFGAAIASYEEVYRASWKKPESHTEFIANMVEKLGSNGFIRLGVMSIGRKPVAAQIWLVCGRKATIFKLAHREDADAFSPGTLLTYWLMSTLVREEGLEEIDLGRGSDAYKRDWLKSSRERIGLIAGNWKTGAGLRTIVRDVVPTRLSASARKTIGLIKTR